MEWRGWVLAVSLLIIAVPVPSLGQAPPEKGVKYEIVIDCPDAQSAVCPVQAVDGQDAMGDPAIAVDPDDPDNMIIASLHGSGDANGPTPKSRSGQAFTTFTSQNHGASWFDNPFTPPDRLGFNAYGEHPAITIDPYGHVYVGSLYSVAVGDNNREPYEYVIVAQKFSSLQEINSNQQGSYNAEYIGSIYPLNRIKQTWFLYDPLQDNMTMVWNEQVVDGASRDAGNYSVPDRIGDTLDDVLPQRRGTAPAALHGLPPGVLPQRDLRDNHTSNQTKAQSVIGVVWSTSSVSSDYHAQKRDHAIGPCSSSTNPVLGYEGIGPDSDLRQRAWLYIGCVVAGGQGGFPWNPAAEPGDIEMFRMDPSGGEPQYIGSAPISGGEPKLGVRSDGRIALMTTEVVEHDDRPRLRLDGTYGRYDPAQGLIQWSKVHRYGDRLQPIYRDTPLVESNIQDMIYREYSGVIHMILKRVVEWPEDDLRATSRPTIYKAVVAIDEKHGILAEFDLGIGHPAVRAQDPTLLAQSDAVFNDLADDFLELPEQYYEYNNRPLGDTYQREFFAVGNYGIVNFAELIEITELRGPAAPPLPNPPPPPNPAPAVATSQVLAAAGALTGAAMIAGTAVTAKRKSIVGAGPKKRR